MVLISKLILLFINFSILSFLAVLITGQVQARHDLNSWAFFYHCLAFAYLTIRGCFWLLTIIATEDWDIFTFYILYWIPSPIELSSFLILPLFLLQILYPDAWKRHWPFWKPLTYGFMASLVVFQVIWSLLSVWDDIDEDGDNGRHTESMVSDFFRWMNAVSFFILSCIQWVYAIEIRHMDDKTYGRYMLAPKRVINYVNAVLTLSFISRSLYQLAAIFNLALLPDIPLQGYDDVDFVIVIFFTLWDYIPTILIIITITSRVIGNTRDNPLSKSKINKASRKSKQAQVKKLKNSENIAAAHSGSVNSSSNLRGDRDDLELSSSHDSNSDRYNSNSEENSSFSGSKNTFVVWKKWLFNETSREIRRSGGKKTEEKYTQKNSQYSHDEENPLLRSSGRVNDREIGIGIDSKNSNLTYGSTANGSNIPIVPKISVLSSKSSMNKIKSSYEASSDNKDDENENDEDIDNDNDNEDTIDYGSLDRFEAPSLRRSMNRTHTSMLTPKAVVSDEGHATELNSNTWPFETAATAINVAVTPPSGSSSVLLPLVTNSLIYNQKTLSHYRRRSNSSSNQSNSDSDTKATAGSRS